MLSALFQEKIVTKQGVEDFTSRQNVSLFHRLVQIQCTKPHDVVKRTAELLAEVGREQERMGLEGQWVLCLFVVVIIYVVCGVVCAYNPDGSDHDQHHMADKWIIIQYKFSQTRQRPLFKEYIESKYKSRCTNNRTQLSKGIYKA